MVKKIKIKVTRQDDGLYDGAVMSFGLTNALATFMPLINDVLRPYVRMESFARVYDDDI